MCVCVFTSKIALQRDYSFIPARFSHIFYYFYLLHRVHPKFLANSRKASSSSTSIKIQRISNIEVKFKQNFTTKVPLDKYRDLNVRIRESKRDRQREKNILHPTPVKPLATRNGYFLLYFCLFEIQ